MEEDSALSASPVMNSELRFVSRSVPGLLSSNTWSFVEKVGSKIRFINQETVKFNELYAELRSQINGLISENRSLTTQLKNNLQFQMETIHQDKSIVYEKNNHQQKLIMDSFEEKESLLEMWHLSLKEIDRLEQELQEEKTHPEAKLICKQMQQMQETYHANVSELMMKLVNSEEEHRQLENRIADHQLEIFYLKNKCERVQTESLEKQKTIEDLMFKEKQLESKFLDLHSFNEVLRKRIHALKLEEVNLNDVSMKMTVTFSSMETKIKELEENKAAMADYSKAIIQMMENGFLEKDQALIQECYAKHDVLRLQKTVAQLLDEAGARTKREVDNVKKYCNERIEKLLEEIRSLQMDNNEKQMQLDRCVREKKLASLREKHLEQSYVQGELQSRENVEQLLQQLTVTLRERNAARECCEEFQKASLIKESKYENKLKGVEDENFTLKAQLRESTSEIEKLYIENKQLKDEVVTVKRNMNDKEVFFEQIIAQLKEKFTSAENEWTIEKELLEAKISVLEESLSDLGDNKNERNSWHRLYTQ